MSLFAKSRVTAVLGPTNTGKTYLAIDRMLGHSSGMIGFPLRLLARENYDRIVRIKGSAPVALVTGEEQILPPVAPYSCCTVGSRPVDRPSSSPAADELKPSPGSDGRRVWKGVVRRCRHRWSPNN